MKYETFIEFTTTFVFILTCLMTDDVIIILSSFAIIMFLYGVTVGLNPLVTIPKALLGRHDAPHLHRALSAQLGGAVFALLAYHLLIKTNIHTRHKLDRI
jgi:glycerol uptake facilitator-like aquaporin